MFRSPYHNNLDLFSNLTVSNLTFKHELQNYTAITSVATEVNHSIAIRRSFHTTQQYHEITAQFYFYKITD